MRKFSVAFIAATALVSGAVHAAKPREVTFSIVKEKEVTRWDPSSIAVHPGETIKITAKHDLDGGPDFHGMTIAPLNIVKQVNRHKAETFEVTIPKDMSGDVPVTCQFHPKHAAAKLTVEAPKATK